MVFVFCFQAHSSSAVVSPSAGVYSFVALLYLVSMGALQQKNGINECNKMHFNPEVFSCCCVEHFHVQCAFDLIVVLVS